MAIQEKRRGIIPPLRSPQDLEMVQVAQRFIMTSLDHSRAASVKLTSESQDLPSITLPPEVLKVVGQLLGLMSQERPIMLMPADQEVSTTEAANFLNVSRPFVIKEIEAGRLKAHKVGSHRRIVYEDLLTYRKAMRETQQEALDRLADINQELGLEY